MRVNGEISLDIVSNENNPRNSEGAFITLKDGRLMYVYSKFLGSVGRDDSRACIACRYSVDYGNTWTDDIIIAEPEKYNALNLMSVSLIRMKNDDIGLFYIIRYGWHDTRLHMQISSDECNSWGEPIKCVPGPGYYVTNNDRIVRLSNGRIVNPTSFIRMKGDDKTQWHPIDRKGIPCFFYSDDEGRTWQESKDYCFINLSGSRGLLEPGVIELNNGTLWQWFRTSIGCQYEAYSVDYGEKWTIPSPSVFTSPDSPLSMKRIPQNSHLLAVWNPIPNYNGKENAEGVVGRTPLVAAISKDDGRTWCKYKIVEDDTDCDYCYTSIHFINDYIFLAYCIYPSHKSFKANILRIRRLFIKDLY